MSAFATVADVEARWRPLTSGEQTIVLTLLDDASDIVRVRYPSIDSDLVSGTVAQATVVRVVAGMVRRAMINRDTEGITQGSEIVGPFQRSASYVNPNGNLYLSKDDLLALDPAGNSPRVRMGWLA